MSNPANIDETAEKLKKDLVPDESRKEYEKVYDDFKMWRVKREVMITNENVLLTYVSDLQEKYAISTMKKKISIIKTMIKIHEKVDTANYVQLQAVINKKMNTHVAKKSLTLTDENYTEFLEKASDDEFLDIKVRVWFHMKLFMF